MTLQTRSNSFPPTPRVSLTTICLQISYLESSTWTSVSEWSFWGQSQQNESSDILQKGSMQIGSLGSIKFTLLLLMLLIHWDIKVVSGCGVCVKFWQKCCPDQRRVFSYCPKKNHLNAVHLKLLGKKKTTKQKQQLAFRPFISTNFMPQASTQLHTGRGIYKRVCPHGTCYRTKDSSEQLWDFPHQEATVGKERHNYFNTLFFTWI